MHLRGWSDGGAAAQPIQPPRPSKKKPRHYDEQQENVYLCLRLIRSLLIHDKVGGRSVTAMSPNSMWDHLASRDFCLLFKLKIKSL